MIPAHPTVEERALPADEELEPVLGEVVIESEGVGDVEALHDHKAQRVREGEGLVVVAHNQRSGAALIVRRDANNCRVAGIDALEHRQGSVVTEAV